MINKKEILQKAKLLSPVLKKECTAKILTYKPTNAKAIVEVKNLNKNYNKAKKTKVVLKDINLNIYIGDRIALVGENGSGKTTLIEIISCVKKATSGVISYNFDYKNSPQEKIGIQFQHSDYPTGLTIKNIIDFVITAYKIDTSRKEINEIVDLFGLTKLVKKQISTLSGGQQQRVNAIIALLHKPKLVLLDELSTGLDIDAQAELRNFLLKYVDEHKISLIISSHNINEILQLCNRLVMIKNGCIIIDVEMKDLIEKFGTINNFFKKYIG